MAICTELSGWTRGVTTIVKERFILGTWIAKRRVGDVRDRGVLTSEGGVREWVRGVQWTERRGTETLSSSLLEWTYSEQG